MSGTSRIPVPVKIHCLYRAQLSCRIGRDALEGSLTLPAGSTPMEWAMFNLLHAVEDLARVVAAVSERLSVGKENGAVKAATADVLGGLPPLPERHVFDCVAPSRVCPRRDENGVCRTTSRQYERCRVRTISFAAAASASAVPGAEAAPKGVDGFLYPVGEEG